VSRTWGRVLLVGADGVRQQVSFRFLASHPGCRPSSRTVSAGADRGRQPKTVKDLENGKLELAQLKMAHLLEGDRVPQRRGTAARDAFRHLGVMKTQRLDHRGAGHLPVAWPPIPSVIANSRLPVAKGGLCLD
jgi:hypothetical protein